ncbi:MAG TPA: hypothetical protein VH741_08815, partial [Candidatus Limnocylindrales bacterium]
MGPSPAIVHAGLRTAAHAGWRTAAVEAVARVLATPSLWLLGALAFLLRGGIVLLTAPVLVLPSPVALRLLIGDNLTSSGFAPGFYALVGAGAATLTGLVLLGLWLACYAELVSFETFNRRFCRSAAERRGLASAVFVIDLVALFALVGAALPLVAGAVDATYVEITRPSTGGGLYERVLGQLGGPLF